GLVTPSKGILDREVEVQIGGSTTKFAEGAKPDFGPGIEVLDVTTSSPTLIVATLRIKPEAKLGPRSVKIGDLEAKYAFTVIPAIRVGTRGSGARVVQGGALELVLLNNDPPAFDTRTFKLLTDGFLALGTTARDAQNGSAFLLAPPLAGAGKGPLTFANIGA